MRNKYLYIELALVILGIAALVTSMTMIHSQIQAILGAVFGGALVQASIAALAIDWSEADRTAQRHPKP